MKRKKKKKRLPFFRRKPKFDPQLDADLERALILVEQGRFEEIIELLQPWADQNVRHPDVYVHLGLAYVQLGSILPAIELLEKSIEIERRPTIVAMAGSLYAMTGNDALALDAYREAERLDSDLIIEEMRRDMAQWEAAIRWVAESRNLSYSRAKEGLAALGRCRIALGNARYDESIRFAQEALRLLGEDYTPALNNLALAYFLNGEWRKAIETTRRVLEVDPDNIFAMANLVKFLAWTGQEEEARRVWARLRTLEPVDDDDLLKMVEAAAVMEDDETVYNLLSFAVDDLDLSPALTERAMLYLAVASANLGKRSEAMGWFRELASAYPRAEDFLRMVKDGRSGPGLMDRFPYFAPQEILSLGAVETLAELLDQEDLVDQSEHVRQQINELVDRFPQIHVLLKQLLLEYEGQDEILFLLGGLKTPQAHDILKAFALGKKGDKEQRLYALDILVEDGVIRVGETVQFWDDGQWVSLNIRPLESPDDYAPEIYSLLDDAYIAMSEERMDDAQTILQRILELDPQVKEALQMLALIRLAENRIDEGRELLERALAIDPDYVFARCNLARLHLFAHRLDKAEEVVQPLRERPESTFNPRELAMWMEIQAQIEITKGDFVKARELLKRGLEVDPDYFPNQEILDRLETLDAGGLGLETLSKLNARLRKEHRAYRLRQQRKLHQPDPTVKEALGIYTKDQMKAMARILAPEGGWSAFKKQALWDLLVARLQDPEVQARLVEGLSDEERQALRAVLDAGGRMDWDAFSHRFGNDLEESPHWEYHEPNSVMGRLRVRGLIVEAMDGDRLLITIPLELREPLRELLQP